MKYNSIADLPPSVANLTLVQKGKLLKAANRLFAQGHEEGAALDAALAFANYQEASIQKSTIETSKAADQMISYEIIYEPDVKDAHGEWMSKETLVKGHANFEAAKASGATVDNLFHLYDTDSFTIVSTWIQPEIDVKVIGTEEIIKAGTWVAKVQYNDVGLWELKKAGIVGGLSIQCGAGLIEETGELVDLDFGVSLEEEE